MLRAVEPGSAVVVCSTCRYSARTILQYAARHAASEEGVVRYGDWPAGVKGHFIVRTPPEGFICT